MLSISSKKLRKMFTFAGRWFIFSSIFTASIFSSLTINFQESFVDGFRPSHLSLLNMPQCLDSNRRGTPERSLLYRSPNTFIRLFDTERSDVELKIVPSIAKGVSAGNSLMNGIQVGTLRIEDTTLKIQTLENLPTEDDDVAVRTKNGGFTHTRSSKAKISAANKGKVPWNKGKSRSEETRARIAAGVRAKNRERFLQKLKDLNMTEEEYEEQKKVERRKKDAERRARKTEKGGYRPTEETKQKISKILKEKWAKGEIKKRRVNKAKVRRGFKHSEETRKKISESLRKRWSEDSDYRDGMLVATTKANTKDETRKRISETLKLKWQDPEFRSKMMEKIKTRKPPTLNAPRHKSYRQKISDAMKAKWQDKEYREKTLASIRKRAQEAIARRPPKPVKKKKLVKVVRTVKQRRPRKKRVVVKGEKKEPKMNVTPLKAKPAKKNKAKTKKKEAGVTGERPKKRTIRARKKEPDGSINRLRNENSDLYDLLYGDEDDDTKTEKTINSIAARLDLGDDNLDNFDPYGLDDF